ncbi:MAG: hypothetical protein MJ108_08005 [Saccharofermentans sp.]|nr:hypothetical protein [Saccharofermentans sp.]
MREKIWSRVLCVFMTIVMMLSIASCDVPTGDSDSDNGIDGLKILLNGNAEDELETDPLVTPCCFKYDNMIMFIQTEYINKIPGDSLGLYDLPQGYRYLVMYITFANGSSGDMSVSTNQFEIYADNTKCDEKYILDDNIETYVSVSSGRVGKITGFYSVPKDAEKVEIEFEKGFISEMLKFEVQEKGMFNDSDLEIIQNEIDNLDKDAETSEETEFVEKPISITDSFSDSFYHSNSQNADYKSTLAHDGDYKTSWQDGSDGDAVGETLTFKFLSNDVYKIVIVNGNRKNNSSYEKNNRLAVANLAFYNDDELVYETKMTFEDDSSVMESVLVLDAPVTCNTLVLTIDEVYAGSSFSDTGIAEVMLYANNK